MWDYRLYGYALIAGSLLLVLMGVTHPSGAGFLASREALEYTAAVSRFAHGSAIAGMLLVALGLAGLSRFLDPRKPAVLAAFITFAIVTAMGMVAPTIDGFVIPQLAERWMGAAEPARTTLYQLMAYCVLVASALTRTYLTLCSFAIVLYSCAIWQTKTSRRLPWLGIVVAVVSIAAGVGGPPIVSVHELLALTLGLTAWLVWAGLILLRAPHEPEQLG